MPPGLEVTVPRPVPDLLTPRANLTGAVAVRLGVVVFGEPAEVPVIVTMQLEPETLSHPAPVQPGKVEPVAGKALSVTVVPLANEAVAPGQAAPQLIPVGLEVTVPLPVPVLVTVRSKVIVLKVAVTVRAAVIVTRQLEPETLSHPAPVQPGKVEPVAGKALSVTVVPSADHT